MYGNNYCYACYWKVVARPFMHSHGLHKSAEEPTWKWLKPIIIIKNIIQLLGRCTIIRPITIIRLSTRKNILWFLLYQLESDCIYYFPIDLEQIKFHLVSNQSEIYKYNLIHTDLTRIRFFFVCQWTHVACQSDAWCAIELVLLDLKTFKITG